MILLKNVTKAYKGKYISTSVLKGINLEIEAGEFIAIMGRSGSGKTTLLNILGCMDVFDEGEYYFNNTNVQNLKGNLMAEFRNKNIGFIFQSFNLVEELNCIENIGLPLGLAHITSKKRKERAFELLCDVDLNDKAYHKPSELSGGQQQRIAIARALANNPKVILADEPTGNLDEKSGTQIMEYLKELNKKKGITIIMVTHDVAVSKYADYILEMKDGKLYYEIDG